MDVWAQMPGDERRNVLVGLAIAFVAVTAFIAYTRVSTSAEDQVRFTDDPTAIIGCDEVGYVTAMTRAGDKEHSLVPAANRAAAQLKTRAIHLGADTVLVIEKGQAIRGAAYSCSLGRGIKNRTSHL